MSGKLQRAQGRAYISFKLRGEETVLDDLFQSGSAKVRFARREPGRLCEGVLINTSGGMTGGDKMDIAIDWGEATNAIVTTQAAERHYQSIGNDARIETKLKVCEDACGYWLPQEAIMFDQAKYQRITKVDLADNSHFLGVESSVFGRAAMDEVVERGCVREIWQVRIGGKLVFYDAFGLSGEVHQRLNHASVTGGLRAISTIIIKFENDGPLLDAIRGIISTQQKSISVIGGASIVERIMVVRLFAENSQLLRKLVMAILEEAMAAFNETDLSNSLLPRVWRS